MIPENDIYKCPICYKIIVFKAFRPSNCSHLFCEKCLVTWSKTKKLCPLCRASFRKIIGAQIPLPWIYIDANS